MPELYAMNRSLSAQGFRRPHALPLRAGQPHTLNPTRLHRVSTSRKTGVSANTQVRMCMCV
jgi:hypothetical protein